MLYTSAEVVPPQDPTGQRLGQIADLLFRFVRKDFNVRIGDCELRYTADPRFVIVCDQPSTVRRLLLHPHPDRMQRAFIAKELDIEGDLLEGLRLKEVLTERSGQLGLRDKLRLFFHLLRL